MVLGLRIEGLGFKEGPSSPNLGCKKGQVWL